MEEEEEKGGGGEGAPKVSAASWWMNMEMKKGERHVFCNRDYRADSWPKG